MTKKDLFRILSKVMGIYFLVNLMVNTLPVMSIFFNSPGGLNTLSFFAVVLFLFFLFLMLIFKPDFFIGILKLEKGFDDDALMVTHIAFSTLLKIAIIFIGLSLMVKKLPVFVTHLLFLPQLFFKSRTGISDEISNSILTNYTDWGIKMITIAIGYLMATNYSAIADFIVKKDSKQSKTSKQ